MPDGLGHRDGPTGSRVRFADRFRRAIPVRTRPILDSWVIGGWGDPMLRPSADSRPSDRNPSMHTSKSYELELDARLTDAPSNRARLRTAATSHEPPGIFAAVEMAVLVIVTVLAMASIILSNTDDRNGKVQTAANSRHTGFGNVAARSLEQREASSSESSR